MTNKLPKPESHSPIKPTLASQENKLYNSQIVSIRSRIDAIIKITGNVTGQVYIFNGAGSIVNVDIRDKDDILDKKRGQACCGGESYTSLFEVI